MSAMSSWPLPVAAMLTVYGCGSAARTCEGANAATATIRIERRIERIGPRRFRMLQSYSKSRCLLGESRETRAGVAVSQIAERGSPGARLPREKGVGVLYRGHDNRQLAEINSLNQRRESSQVRRVLSGRRLGARSFWSAFRAITGTRGLRWKTYSTRSFWARSGC